MFDAILSFLHTIHDVQGLIEWGGLLLVCAIIFVETGLFIGFFLPGDSLLFTAGVFAAAGYLDITLLLLLGTACAILGDQLGYFIGSKMGPLLFRKEDSRFFKRKHLESAAQFYDKHGNKAIVLARFIPIVRTFAPVVAGAAKMDYKRFTIYNIIGGVLWVGSMTLAGYALGSLIPDIERYLHYIVLVIIFLSILPMVFHYYKERRGERVEKEAGRKGRKLPPARR